MSTGNSGGKVMLGGMPYGPDVKRLIEAFPVPELEEGRLIPHEDLEKAVQAKKGTSRYYGVINSWISTMRDEDGIHLAWDHSMGISVLDPASLLSFREVKLRQKARQTASAINAFKWVAAVSHRLDDMGRKRLTHIMESAAKLKMALQESKKEMAIDLSPIKSLPKPPVRES